MNSKPFASFANTARDLGLDVEAPFSLELPCGLVQAPLWLKNFGYEMGILLVPSPGALGELAVKLPDFGYGFAVLPADKIYDRESVISLCRAWRWTGSGAPPAWYAQFAAISHGSAQYQAELQLRDHVLRQPLGVSVYDEALEKESAFQHYGLLVAERLLACLVVKPVSAGLVQIGQMAVAPDAQGRGYGTRLMREVEVVLSMQQVKRIQLAARVTAVEFYQKLGYRECGTTFMHLSIPHIMMHKALG